MNRHMHIPKNINYLLLPAAKLKSSLLFIFLHISATLRYMDEEYTERILQISKSHQDGITLRELLKIIDVDVGLI